MRSCEGACDDVRVAASMAARLRGLLGTDDFRGQLLLVPCHDVHTFGMRYAIDVAFVDRRGVVVKAARDVEPGRRIRCHGACMVLERKSGVGRQWYREGERIAVAPAG